MNSIEKLENGNVLIKDSTGEIVHIIINVFSVNVHPTNENMVLLSDELKSTEGESLLINSDEVNFINDEAFSGTRNDLLIALSELFKNGGGSSNEGTANENQQEINQDMSVISQETTNGIVKIDARNSTTNGNATGGVFGKHSYIFNGQFNKPKINGTTQPLTLNAANNTIIVNGVGEKDIAGNTWNSYIYSTESFNPLTENFAYSWVVESVDGTIREMGGFDNDPTQTQSYSTIEYAIYQVNNYFYSSVYEKGKAIKIPNYTTFYLQVGDRIGVMCVNQKVSYFVLRGGIVTIIYTSEELATEPLFFKGAFNRGVGSSGESKLGDVVFHDETEIDNFSILVEGNATDIVSDAHKQVLKAQAGIDLLSASKYSLLEFMRLDAAKFKTGGVFNEVEFLHEFRALANQTSHTVTTF